MMLLSTLKEFCETTSIHGLGFIVKANSSLYKRTAWFVIFLISISYAGIQLKENVDSKLTVNNPSCLIQGLLELLWTVYPKGKLQPCSKVRNFQNPLKKYHAQIRLIKNYGAKLIFRSFATFFVIPVLHWVSKKIIFY